MCGSWLAGLAPPLRPCFLGVGTPKCPQCSSGSVFGLFSPRLPPHALPTSSLFPASSVLLFLNSCITVNHALVYPVCEASPGGVACTQPSLHEGEPGKLPPFLPWHGDTGHWSPHLGKCPVEPVLGSLSYM